MEPLFTTASMRTAGSGLLVKQELLAVISLNAREGWFFRQEGKICQATEKVAYLHRNN